MCMCQYHGPTCCDSTKAAPSGCALAHHVSHEQECFDGSLDSMRNQNNIKALLGVGVHLATVLLHHTDDECAQNVGLAVRM